MTWVFFGTDEFAASVLTKLLAASWRPTLVVTTPDQPKGRKLVLTPPPVKIFAQKNNIPFIQPASLKTDLEIEKLKIVNYELFIVASYGKIIPEAIINLPTCGILNIHPSLLPRYRGAAPIQEAILHGDKKTAVTIMEVDQEMDHGPIIAQAEYSLTGHEDFIMLRDQLAVLGANLLIKVLPEWLAGTVKAKAQDHSQATYTKKIVKEDGLIDLADDPIINDRKIRAYTPWPGTYFFTKKNNKDTRVIIRSAHLENNQLIIDRVIPEGKKETSWLQFSKS